MVLTDILAQLATILPVLGGILAYLVAHPTEAAVVDLAVANILDWSAGMALGAAKGEFDRQRVPEFMYKWLPSDVPMVYAALIAALGTAVAGAFVHQINLAGVVNALLLAAAGAAAVYSMPTWGDLLEKLVAIYGQLRDRWRTWRSKSVTVNPGPVAVEVGSGSMGGGQR